MIHSTFFFSNQDPTDESSVYETSRKFACALVNRSAPTVLVRGGNFAKEHELPVEAVLPFAFPYGSGGPKTKRATAISLTIFSFGHAAVHDSRCGVSSSLVILKTIILRNWNYDLQESESKRRS